MRLRMLTVRPQAELGSVPVGQLKLVVRSPPELGLPVAGWALSKVQPRPAQAAGQPKLVVRSQSQRGLLLAGRALPVVLPGPERRFALERPRR